MPQCRGTIKIVGLPEPSTKFLHNSANSSEIFIWRAYAPRRNELFRTIQPQINTDFHGFGARALPLRLGSRRRDLCSPRKRTFPRLAADNRDPPQRGTSARSICLNLRNLWTVTSAEKPAPPAKPTKSDFLRNQHTYAKRVFSPFDGVVGLRPAAITRMRRCIAAIGLALLFIPPASARARVAQEQRRESLLARVTVYWASGDCGSDAYTRRHQSSTGVRLRVGHCAVDPRRIPYRSKVVLPDGVFTAVDTGAAVISRKAARRSGRTASQRNALVIDRFFETKRQALAWANSHPEFMTVEVIPPGSRAATAQPARQPGSNLVRPPATQLAKQSAPRLAKQPAGRIARQPARQLARFPALQPPKPSAPQFAIQPASIVESGTASRTKRIAKANPSFVEEISATD